MPIQSGDGRARGVSARTRLIDRFMRAYWRGMLARGTIEVDDQNAGKIHPRSRTERISQDLRFYVGKCRARALHNIAGHSNASTTWRERRRRRRRKT